MENIGYWCGLKKDVYTPFQRWGVNWYIGIDKSNIVLPLKGWEININEFIDNINENRIFKFILPFGKIEKDIPLTTRLVCKETFGYKATPPFTPIFVIMNDFIPEKYIHYHPTFFVKGTKKGILTSCKYQQN